MVPTHSHLVGLFPCIFWTATLSPTDNGGGLRVLSIHFLWSFSLHRFILVSRAFMYSRQGDPGCIRMLICISGKNPFILWPNTNYAGDSFVSLSGMFMYCRMAARSLLSQETSAVTPTYHQIICDNYFIITSVILEANTTCYSDVIPLSITKVTKNHLWHNCYSAKIPSLMSYHACVSHVISFGHRRDMTNHTLLLLHITYEGSLYYIWISLVVSDSASGASGPSSSLTQDNLDVYR